MGCSGQKTWPRTAARPSNPAIALSALPWKEAREQYLASFEMTYAQSVLARCNGNVSAAAREAGVDRKTFYALLQADKESQSGESDSPDWSRKAGNRLPNLTGAACKSLKAKVISVLALGMRMVVGMECLHMRVRNLVVKAVLLGIGMALLRLS